MTSQNIIIMACFSPNDKKAEDKLMSFLRKGSNMAFEHEPGTLKYAFATNRDETDARIYVLEQYADRNALDFHAQQPHIQELIEWLQTGEAGQPEIRYLDQFEGFEFVRPEVTTHTDPLFVLTDIEYKPHVVETVIPYWKAVFESTRDNERGALHWQLAQDSSNPDKVFVAHTYESQDYLMSVHVAGEELIKLQAFVKETQVSLKANLLKFRGGYLTK